MLTRFLIIILFVFHNFTVQWNINDVKVGLSTYNKEIELVQQGKEDYKQFLHSNYPRKRLLCSTFLKLSHGSAVVNTLFNIHSSVGCDWAVIIYSGSINETKRFCSRANFRNSLVLCELFSRTAEIENIRSKYPSTYSEEFLESLETSTIPKTVLYSSLLPVLPQYERVFLMDEDISLIGWDMNKTLALWDCSGFASPPLVAQLLIFEDTQYLTYVLASKWRAEREKERERARRGDGAGEGEGIGGREGWEDALISRTGLVEQQVPMFDSLFFQWFVRRVLGLVRERAFVQGVDWGHDRTWCNAAAAYGKNILGWGREAQGGSEGGGTGSGDKSYLSPFATYPSLNFSHSSSSSSFVSSSSSLSYSPCTLLLSPPPLHHFNTKSIDMKRNDPSLFRSRGFSMVSYYSSLFPSWTNGMDVLGVVNPLSWEGRRREILEEMKRELERSVARQKEEKKEKRGRSEKEMREGKEKERKEEKQEEEEEEEIIEKRSETLPSSSHRLLEGGRGVVGGGRRKKKIIKNKEQFTRERLREVEEVLRRIEIGEGKRGEREVEEREEERGGGRGSGEVFERRTYSQLNHQYLRERYGEKAGEREYWMYEL